MIELIISKNDADQRFDRFLRKYFPNAPLSVIQKNIRKKNFKINDTRAKADMFVYEGDIIKMYISDENHDRWIDKKTYKPRDFDLDIVYEDENIIIMDKKPGMLTHSASSSDYGDNLVDNMIAYLYKTKAVNSRDKTFTPAVVNRLDRNTAGLVIGAKNANALRALNEAMRENKIDKYYLTLVNGKVDKAFTIDTNISKNESKNKIKASKSGDRILTHFRPLKTNGKYSLLECELITGKTHQIRFSLRENNTPIIGDRKYGDKNINDIVKSKLNIDNQVLLAYKLRFNKIDGLEYLAGKIIESKQIDDVMRLQEQLFKL